MAPDSAVVTFGGFSLDLAARKLRRGDDVLPLSSRAFDILSILVEHAGKTVSRTELMERVWPDVYVEEANLAQQVSHLRRLLGDTAREPAFIVTVPRQGYRFIAPVGPTRAEAPAGQVATAVEPRAHQRWSRVAGAVAVASLILVAALVWHGGVSARPPSSNDQAMRAFQRGRFLMAQNTREGTPLARDAFAEAVKDDPAFGDAHAHLALSYVSLFLAREVGRAEAIERSQDAAQVALRLDPGSSAAHMAEGAILLQLLGQPVGAETELRRAALLDESNVMALDLLARALRHSGRFDESIAVARQALALDTTSVRAHMNLAQSLLFAGQRLDEAGDLCRQALDLDRASPTLLVQAADVAEADGRLGESIEYRARAERAANRPAVADDLERAYRERGFVAALASYAETRLAALDRAKPADGFERGRLLARLGRVDEAFDALEVAVAGEFSVGVYALRYHPAYRALRADPRFQALETATNPRR